MNRLEWLERRRPGIGSSDAGAVCGLSRFKTPLHVYFDKRGQLPPSDNRAMKWGNLLEEVVAAAYEEETGIGLLNQNGDIDVNPRLPWQMATGDIFLNSRTDDYTPGDEIELNPNSGVWWEIIAVHQRVNVEYESTYWLEIRLGYLLRLANRDDFSQQYQLAPME